MSQLHHEFSKFVLTYVAIEINQSHPIPELCVITNRLGVIWSSLTGN